MEKKTYLTPQVVCLNFRQPLMLIGSLTITDEDADPSGDMLSKRPSIWDYYESDIDE